VRVNKSDLLTALESVQPGLTMRDVVEQSSCFVFRDEEVMTFNDEVACRRKSPLKIEGAVPAGPLLAILRKLPEEELDITLEKGLLIVRGKGRKVSIRMQEEIALPIEKVEAAEDWKPLHEDFSDAIYVNQQCVGKDESDYAATCIHIDKKFIEACDGSQAIRYKIKTKVRESMLVRGSSIKHIVSLDMTEFAETDSWIHFRNPTGLIFSCRRDTQTYEPIDSILDVDGHNLTLPKGLAEAADRAEVFSAENADENEVLVDINADRLRITGTGVSGKIVENKKINYDGEPIAFHIGPKLLVELVKRYNDCVVSPTKLMVDTGKFVYVAALGDPGANNNKDDKAKDE